jgi:hypothetical protein
LYTNKNRDGATMSDRETVRCDLWKIREQGVGCCVGQNNV